MMRGKRVLKIDCLLSLTARTNGDLLCHPSAPIERMDIIPKPAFARGGTHMVLAQAQYRSMPTVTKDNNL
jgi:hypothetical protein